MKLPLIENWDGQTYLTDQDGKPVGRDEMFVELNRLHALITSRQKEQADDAVGSEKK